MFEWFHWIWSFVSLYAARLEVEALTLMLVENCANIKARSSCIADDSVAV